MDRHYIKEKQDSGLICISYVSISGQLANIPTTGLVNDSYQAITNKLGIEDINSPA